MQFLVWLSAMVVVVGHASATGHASAAGAPKPVTWDEVRAALAETICMSVTEHQGKEYFSPSAGLREPCQAPAASTPLQRAVDKANAAAGGVLASAKPDTASALAEGLSRQERTRRVRGAYLSDAVFLRAILKRLPPALQEEGLACADCPVPPALPTRTVTWEEFSPYVAAYVWPAPVRTPVGPDGKPTGQPPRYSFHVCSGLNGLAGLKDPDPVLVRAAFVAAFGNAPFLKIAGQSFERALGSSEFQALTDDDARTAYLREVVPSGAVGDPAARKTICAGLAKVADDVGVVVAECASP